MIWICNYVDFFLVFLYDHDFVEKKNRITNAIYFLFDQKM